MGGGDDVTLNRLAELRVVVPDALRVVLAAPRRAKNRLHALAVHNAHRTPNPSLLADLVKSVIIKSQRQALRLVVGIHERHDSSKSPRQSPTGWTYPRQHDVPPLRVCKPLKNFLGIYFFLKKTLDSYAHSMHNIIRRREHDEIQGT